MVMLMVMVIEIEMEMAMVMVMALLLLLLLLLAIWTDILSVIFAVTSNENHQTRINSVYFPAIYETNAKFVASCIW